jgi:hypothetical protein
MTVRDRASIRRKNPEKAAGPTSIAKKKEAWRVPFHKPSRQCVL